MNEQRGNLYLITGLIIGLAAGLLFAWVISPVKYVDTEPASLAPEDKDHYRQVIALAYQASSDLGRARQRINLVDPGSSAHFLAAQAQRMRAENAFPQEARALADLAADMNAAPSATNDRTDAVSATQPSQPTQAQFQAETTAAPTENMPLEVAAVQSPTPQPSPTSSPTPAPTFTPRPTATPRRVLDAPFVMKQKTEICGSDAVPGLLQVLVTGSDGEPLPGVQIVITAQDGQDIFYTGLYPEINLGYADFVMAAGETYALKVGEVSDIEQGIAIPACGGGWRIEFEEGKN